VADFQIRSEQKNRIYYAHRRKAKDPDQLSRCRLKEDSTNVRNARHTVHQHHCDDEVADKCRPRIAEEIKHGEVDERLDDHIEQVHHILRHKICYPIYS